MPNINTKKHEAELDKIAKSQHNMLCLFCPIIKGQCRTDCACFAKGEIKVIRYSDGSEKNTTQLSCCTHPFIDGAGVISIYNC